MGPLSVIGALPAQLYLSLMYQTHAYGRLDRYFVRRRRCFHLIDFFFFFVNLINGGLTFFKVERGNGPCDCSGLLCQLVVSCGAHKLTSCR